MEMRFSRQRVLSFTLIELLVVIVIVAVLMGLAFPVFQGVQNQAKKTQAKNDVTQIVTAVNAYYTEYGKYPLLDSQTSANADAVFGDASNPHNDKLLNVLRIPLGFSDTQNAGGPQNPRNISFISPPDAKDPTSPRGGILNDPNSNPANGRWYDPWGTEYIVFIDANYDNRLTLFSEHYSDVSDPSIGVGAMSFGKDKAWGKSGAYRNSDDIISWQ